MHQPYHLPNSSEQQRVCNENRVEPRLRRKFGRILKQFLSWIEQTKFKMSAVSREMMFYFCEPYFHTLDRWMKYDDRHLLCNRLQVMAALIEILNARYDSETTYEIEQTETDEPLLPAVHPSAGETFCDGYDLHAFHTAGTLVSPAVFQTGGLYFQKNLLRALSFGNASTKENFRDSPAIIALRQLFRLSKESGPASLYSCKYNYMGYEDRDLVPLVDLTPDTWTLHDSLIANMVILKAAAEAKRVAAVASAIPHNFTVIEAEPIEEEVPTVTSSTAAAAGGGATVAATVTVSAQATPNATAMVIDEVHTEPIQQQHQQANADSNITESNEGMMEVAENIIADADSMFTDGTSCVYSHEGIESGSRADIIPDATGSAMKVTVFEEVPSDSASQVEVQADVTDKMTVNDAVESDVEDDEYVLLPSSIVILDKNQEVQDPSSEILDKNQNQNSVTSSSSQSAQNDLKGSQSAVPAPITLVAFTLTAVPATAAAAAAAATLAASTSSSSESATLPSTATTAATGATTNTKESETATSIAENVSNKSDQTAALSVTINSPKRKRERGSSIDDNNNMATEEESGGGRRSSKRVQHDQTHKDKDDKDKEKDAKRNSQTSPSGISSSRSSSRLSVSNESEEKGTASGKKAVRTAVKIIEKRIEDSKEELEKENAKRRKITKSTGTSKNKNSNSNADNNDENTEEGGEEEEEDGEEEEEENEEINEEEWLFEHPSIGTKVAGIFQKASRKSRNKTSTVFYGEVTKFLSESGENERDELYHILWEDGDEEDYDTCDLTEGVRRYKLDKKNR